MRKLPILIVASLCLLVFGACGGASKGTPTPTPDFETMAQGLLPNLPLALSEMPEGWELSREGDTQFTHSVELPSECNIFNLRVAFPNAFVTVAGPEFDRSGRQVTSYGAIYLTRDDAQEDVDGTRDILDICQEDYKSAVEKIADEELSALGISLGFLASIDVTLVELPEATGEGSRFYRLQARVNLPGDDLTFTLDAQVVRIGRVVGALTYYTQGEGGTDDERDISEALLANAREADRALPQ